MSLSLSCFSKLWGVVTVSSAQPHRVSVPIRNLCTYLAESLSRTIERLSLERRLQARNIINHSATSDAPGGHIIAESQELLKLFEADWGCLS
jgi:light-regulated signal transduction histidine kinase (bacteriophytochrome)